MKINLFKKSMLVAMVMALVTAALPLTSALADSPRNPTIPPVEGERSNTRIERLWARESRGVERYGNMLDRSENVVEKTQKLIDRAKENGRNVTALQAALDAYEQAAQGADSMYEAARATVDKHAGFDADGKVTDREQAMQTLKDLGAQLKDLRGQIGLPGRALREAIRAFRNVNPPADDSTGA
jgi:hypothetical protein